MPPSTPEEFKASQYARGVQSQPVVDQGEVEMAAQAMLAPFDAKGGENPYTLHRDLRDCMHRLVGIIRTESELLEALDHFQVFKQRLSNVSIEGNRQFNPGWHLTLDLHAMLPIADVVTRSALERKESRGGHTRDDYPNPDPEFGKLNVAISAKGGELNIRHEPLKPLPDDLKEILEAAS
jgi:succinate dehydrogenase / fumarate reductase flavoprotein subunit